MTDNKPITYYVEIVPVREVSLLGNADLIFWQERLQQQNLAPTVRNGRAQVLICAVDSKFNGMRFRELSISIVVESTTARFEKGGVFLVQAFNSSRFFAFVERNWFHTPYVHAGLHVDCRIPAACSVSQGGGVIFGAQMSADRNPGERVPLRSGDECWEGPIFLPRRRPSAADRLFFGRLRGQTQSYAFDPSGDRVMLDASCEIPVIQALIGSNFSSNEWQIRENAIHAKSKTTTREPPARQ